MFNLKSKHKNSNWRFALGVQNSYEETYRGLPHCLLQVAFFNRSFWFEIPEIFKPEWENNTRNIRDYSFSCDREAFHFYYGIQKNSSNMSKSKLIWNPINKTNRVRYDFLNLDGTLSERVYDKPSGAINFHAIEAAIDAVQKISFSFNDYDGEPITATCHLEEMEWRYGSGIWKYLLFFRKPVIRRRLEIYFDKETGRRKGSWKGGTMANSIDIKPGESPQDAFKRYGTSEFTYEKYIGKVYRDFTNINVISPLT